MTSKKRLLATAMAAALLLSAIAAGSTAANDSVTDDSIVVAVGQAGNDEATVTITQNDSAVENASVIVEVEDDGTYAGAGNYSTGENGTVELPAPEENVSIHVTAAKGNLTAETTAELTAAAEEEKPEKQTFGQMVSSFVQEMLDGGNDDGALGQLVSEYVTSNNPGSEKKADNAGKPDHAGKSGDVGQQNATDENESQGPPENVGPSDDGDETDDDDEGTDDDNEKDGDRGNGKKNGHGTDRGNGNDH